MKFSGKVLNKNEETRDLVGKDGNVRKNQVCQHILLLVGEGAETEVLNIRAWNQALKIPAIGQAWETPRIRSYNRNGDVAEVAI